MNSFILQATTRVILGLMILLSLFILLRGHNEPGGGFIGALIAGAAFALYKYAFDITKVKASLIVPPQIISVLGVSLALGSGIFGMFYGLPFLTGISGYILGKIYFSSILIFDIGVYLAVLGVILTLFVALEEDY